jgi:hypothetical protein
MPVWPKSFYTFGVNLKTAGAEWKLRHKRGAEKAQHQALARLTPRLATTSYWKRAGVEAGMPYAKFQARVPLRSPEHLAPAIAQMQRGERDVLWPGRCALFALTAGTSTGTPHALPVTEELLAHFRRAGLDALLYYTVRVRHAGAFRGRHLLLGDSTELTPLESGNPHKAYASPSSGIVAVNLPRWAEKHLYEPGANAARLSDWDAKLEAIAARTSGRDVSLVAGLPNWVITLANEIRAAGAKDGRALAHLQQLWPNLECFVHTGLPVAPFANELRANLGPAVKFHEVYAATEGFIATQDADAAKGLRLMTDMGVFFEFLPMTDFEDGRLEQLGAKAVPLEGVKPGIDYAVVITTPGGLARYVLGDVVRFVSTEPPRIVYVGRTQLRLHAWGENVTEKEVTDTLVTVCQRHDWTIVNFHVGVIVSGSSLTGQTRGRHEWWIELKPGTIATPIGPQIAAELDAELQRANPEYAARRKSGAIDSPIVRLVMPGVFEHWLRFQGKWGGQQKLARCRSDRLLADPLAQVTNFAQD